MSKSYPTIEVKCNECGVVVVSPIEYASEQDRWTKEDGMTVTVFVPGWTLRDGINAQDYCADCTRKFEDN